MSTKKLLYLSIHLFLFKLFFVNATLQNEFQSVVSEFDQCLVCTDVTKLDAKQIAIQIGRTQREKNLKVALLIIPEKIAKPKEMVYKELKVTGFKLLKPENPRAVISYSINGLAVNDQARINLYCSSYLSELCVKNEPIVNIVERARVPGIPIAYNFLIIYNKNDSIKKE